MIGGRDTAKDAKPAFVAATTSKKANDGAADDHPTGGPGKSGLKHDCVVAYTDKGTGIGVHDLTTNTVNSIDGLRQIAAAAGKTSNFTASVSGIDFTTFNAANPNRIAVKHAHSQQNPEKDW